MRYAKFVVALLFVFAAVTAGAAPPDDHQPRGPIQRVIAFLRHIAALDEGGVIQPPLP